MPPATEDAQAESLRKAESLKRSASRRALRQQESRKTYLAEGVDVNPVLFSPRQFLVELYTHFLYNSLGIITLPLLYWAYGKHKNLWCLKNRQFLTTSIFRNVTDTVQVVAQVLLYYLYWTERAKIERIITPLMAVFFVTLLRLRDVVVAIKYSFVSPESWERRNTQELSPEEFSRELLVLGWFRISKISFMKEIYASIARTRFPVNASVRLTFDGVEILPDGSEAKECVFDAVKKLGCKSNKNVEWVYDEVIPHFHNDERKHKVEVAELWRKNRCQTQSGVTGEALDHCVRTQLIKLELARQNAMEHDTDIPVLHLAHFLIGLTQRDKNVGRAFASFMGIAFCIYFAPLFLKIATGTLPISAITPIYIVLLSMMLFPLIVNFAANYLFLLIAYFDFQRRFTAMVLLGALLTDDPVTRHAKEVPYLFRFFPRIDMTRIEGATAWLALRQLYFDFGRTFRRRIDSFMTIFFAASMLLLLYIIIAVYVFQDIDLGTLIIVEANSLMLAIFLLLLVGKSLEVNNSHHKQAWLILQAQQDVTEDVGQLKEGVLSDLQQEHTVIGGVAAGKQANKRWTAQELIAMLGPQSKGTRRTSGRASMTLSEREALKATEKEKAEMSERRNVKYTTQNEGDSEWGAQLEERVNNAVEDEPSIVKPPQSPARIKRDQTEGGEKGKKGVPEQKGESLLDVRGGEQVEAVYCEGTVEKETVKQQKPPMKKKGSEKCLHWSTTEVGGGFLDPSSLARAVARERRKSQDVEDIAGRINQERQRRRRNRQEEEEEQDGEASPLTSNQLSPGEFVGVDDEEEEGGEGDRLFGDDDELSCPDEGQEDSSRIFPKHVLSQVKRLKRLQVRTLALQYLESIGNRLELLAEQVRVSAETEMITLMGFKASTDMISLIGALPLFTLSSLAQFCATDGAQCFRLE